MRDSPSACVVDSVTFASWREATGSIYPCSSVESLPDCSTGS